ncbi:hypothetical protein fugu_005638 [Takifugu bimaculatus]|uniref:Uncharacterized protein n=1 Tax=Takifugu bimaculatus TaxID=433685 RepID=A0A4Z2B5K0_9TELE|nr:hypothetical protein fugu_005638 [Takifugu bimaculatus]
MIIAVRGSSFFEESWSHCVPQQSKRAMAKFDPHQTKLHRVSPTTPSPKSSLPQRGCDGHLSPPLRRPGKENRTPPADCQGNREVKCRGFGLVDRQGFGR